ncbi:MAG TPA: hypothetical protein EYP40_07495 [Chromatiales bacterium]|nr:hypothetical protein [Chromatiales bacterium]
MPESQDKLLKAYNTMRAALKSAWHEAGQKALPTLKQALDAAEQKVSDLDELSREEIQRLSEYLKRDLQEAGEALADNSKKLAEWLEFDTELVESRLSEWVAQVANPTIVELERLREQARLGEWHTGEITGPGILTCQGCGEQLHFDQPGHIPPCPRCHATVFSKEY